MWMLFLISGWVLPYSGSAPLDRQALLCHKQPWLFAGMDSCTPFFSRAHMVIGGGRVPMSLQKFSTGILNAFGCPAFKVVLQISATCRVKARDLLDIELKVLLHMSREAFGSDTCDS